MSAEILDGDNQYEAPEHGKQDAKKFIRFKKFPPVLQVQVNRFDYDFERDAMMKKNDQFLFSEVLNIDDVLSEETNQSQCTNKHKKVS